MLSKLSTWFYVEVGVCQGCFFSYIVQHLLRNDLVTTLQATSMGVSILQSIVAFYYMLMIQCCFAEKEANELQVASVAGRVARMV